MAVQTPVSGSLELGVTGDKRYVMATFASVANNDTYNAPLGIIRGLSVDSGNAASIQAGATFSGATVTFVTTGTATNVLLLAYGY